MKTLIISHGHPAVNPGGAEHSAYNLFTELLISQKVEAHFLSINSTNSTPKFDDSESPKTFNEHWLTSTSDPFQYTNQNPDECWPELFTLLDKLKPEIIHFHHFLHIGIDSIGIIKRQFPFAKICLTLHDYRALCLNDGLMLTSQDHRRCYKSSPDNCHQCAPYKSPEIINKRHQAIQRALKSCDALISPSQFLVDLFKNNELEHPCMKTIGNGIKHAFQPLEPSAKLDRFGFFGKTTEFKGLIVLLKAIYHLRKNTNKSFTLDIFGEGLQDQPAAFQHRIQLLLKGDAVNNINWHGSYQSTDIPQLMKRVDWVVVPSIWWENSPLVIQEAFAHGRPVIGSDIGGIAENILGRGGLKFGAGSAEDLASVMTKAIGDYDMYRCLQDSITAPLSSKQSAEEHISLYQELLYRNG